MSVIRHVNNSDLRIAIRCSVPPRGTSNLPVASLKHTQRPLSVTNNFYLDPMETNLRL